MVESKKKFEVTLSMNEEEAKWLMGVMQNPILAGTSDVHLIRESKEDSGMRTAFWEALKSQGVSLG